MTNKYVHYVLGDNGNDGLSELTPKKTSGGTTFSAGDRIALAGGVVYQGAFTIGGSGTESAPITITSYGSGKYKINRGPGGGGGNSGCVYATGREWLVIENGEVYGATEFPHAGVLLRNSSHCVVRNMHAHDNQYGIRIDNDSSSEITDHFISNCIAEDNSNTGITVTCGTSSGGVTRGVKIWDCISRRSGIAVSGTYSDVYSLHVTTRITTSGASSVYDATRVVHDLDVRRCVFDTCPGYGINLRYVTGLKFIGCEVTGSGYGEQRDTHSLWLGGCLNGQVIGNHIHHNFGQALGVGSGVGIFVDQGGQNASSGHDCRNIAVVGNYIHDQWQGPQGTDGVTASAGIFVYRSVDTTICGNVIARCRNGVVVRGATTMNTERTKIYNNTLVDLQITGIGVNNLSDATDIKNNIILRCGVGLHVESGSVAAVNTTEDYNCVYGSTRYNFATGTLVELEGGTETEASAGVNDIKENPLLDSSYRPLTGSPVIGGGTYIPGARDFAGRKLKRTPDIGARQYYEPRGVVSPTRTAKSNVLSPVGTLRTGRTILRPGV